MDSLSNWTVCIDHVDLYCILISNMNTILNILSLNVRGINDKTKSFLLVEKNKIVTFIFCKKHILEQIKIK